MGVPGTGVRSGDPDRCLKDLESVQGRLLKTLFTNCQTVRRDDKNLRGEMQRCHRRGEEKILYNKLEAETSAQPHVVIGSGSRNQIRRTGVTETLRTRALEDNPHHLGSLRHLCANRMPGNYCSC